MRLFAPHYYGSFKCIADKCTHSCCIGWEIDIDEATSFKYSMLSGGYGINIRNSIDHTDTPHFRLCENERCPHLSDSGLCNIITELSEDFLCDICREHPRFYNFTSRGKEVGIGMSCEEACRIILTSDNYADFIELDSIDGEIDEYGFDAVAERERIYQMLSDVSIVYSERLESIYRTYNVSPRIFSDNEWRDIIASLEYLDESHKALFMNFSSDAPVTKEIEPFLERALAYFVFRHCSEAYDRADFSSRLGFCFFCERLMASVIYAENPKQLCDIIRLAGIVSEEIEYSEENTESVTFEFFGKS